MFMEEVLRSRDNDNDNNGNRTNNTANFDAVKKYGALTCLREIYTLLSDSDAQTGLKAQLVSVQPLR